MGEAWHIKIQSYSYSQCACCHLLIDPAEFDEEGVCVQCNGGVPLGDRFDSMDELAAEWTKSLDAELAEAEQGDDFEAPATMTFWEAVKFHGAHSLIGRIARWGGLEWRD